MIEVMDAYMDFDKEFKKAQDFHRRLCYRYDWLQVERCSDGKITTIDNLDELRSKWLLLEERVKKDYTGAIVDKYLKNISTQFSEDDHFKNIFNQYKEFGLLFMGIPSVHNKNWYGKRVINMDNHPDSSLIETITLTHENEKCRTYNIELVQNPDSPITLMEAGGELDWNKKSNMPRMVNVKIRYCYDETIINEWDFKTERIFE
jgi:hypothetical protein